MGDDQQVFAGMEALCPDTASPDYVRAMIEAMRATLAAARHNTRVLNGKEA